MFGVIAVGVASVVFLALLSWLMALPEVLRDDRDPASASGPVSDPTERLSGWG